MPDCLTNQEFCKCHSSVGFTKSICDSLSSIPTGTRWNTTYLIKHKQRGNELVHLQHTEVFPYTNPSASTESQIRFPHPQTSALVRHRRLVGPLQPPLRVERFCILAKDGLVLVDHPCIHAHDRACLDKASVRKGKTLIGDDALER